MLWFTMYSSSGHNLTLFFANFEVGHCSSQWSRILIIRPQTIVLFVSVVLFHTLIQSVSCSLCYLISELALTVMASPITWKAWCEATMHYPWDCLFIMNFIGLCLFTLLLRWHVSSCSSCRPLFSIESTNASYFSLGCVTDGHSVMDFSLKK